MSNITGSVLRLVCLVSAHYGWARQQVWSATSASVRQRTQLSIHIRSRYTLAHFQDVKQATNNKNLSGFSLAEARPRKQENWAANRSSPWLSPLADSVMCMDLHAACVFPRKKQQGNTASEECVPSLLSFVTITLFVCCDIFWRAHQAWACKSLLLFARIFFYVCCCCLSFANLIWTRMSSPDSAEMGKGEATFTPLQHTQQRMKSVLDLTIK